jgi:5-methylcytosine-specific restriction endonuclease McrA
MKKTLAKKADKVFKEAVILKASYRCEVCGSTFGITAHHYFPRSTAGHMIYLLENGVCLCRGCHFSHHTKSDPRIHNTINRQRGTKWLNKLEAIKKEKHSSFKTVQFYQESINKLKT